MSVVEVEKKGALAFFTLNRPDKFNAVNPAMVEALNQTMMEFMEDDSLRVGIITGKGEKAFCSGADVVEWLPYVKETADRPWRIPPILTRGQYVTKPLIAAVNGIAFGLGGEIAMACDLRIAADTATFRWPEPRLGILPRMGGTQRLPRLVGYGRAMEILLTNEKLDAQTALRDGLWPRPRKWRRKSALWHLWLSKISSGALPKGPSGVWRTAWLWRTGWVWSSMPQKTI